LKPQDPFESQLNEILDSGPSEEIVPENRNPVPPNRIKVPQKKRSSTRVELLIRIAGGIALLALLLGFALRIALF
jgi:hypothetical protein